MAHKYSTFFRWIHILVDYLILNFTLYALFFLAAPDTFWIMDDKFRLLMLLLNLWWFYCTSLFNGYQNILTRDSVSTLKTNIMSLVLFGIIVFFFKYILTDLFVTSFTLSSFFILFPFIILTWKTGFLFLRKSRRKFWISYNKCAIVGAGQTGINLYKYIMANPQLGYDVVGIFDDGKPEEQPGLN